MKAWEGVAIWVALGLLLQSVERHKNQAAALAWRSVSRKPILSVGARRDLFGDVRCDLNPAGPDVQRCDAQALPYRNKQFSVAYLSHVLEHVDDPRLAYREAQRVADTVIAATPSPLFPMAWIMPGHKWIMASPEQPLWKIR